MQYYCFFWVLIIPKKNIFNWRIAIVYVLLNSITTISNRYPIPNIPHIECKLKINSKLILVKKYYRGSFYVIIVLFISSRKRQEVINLPEKLKNWSNYFVPSKMDYWICHGEIIKVIGHSVNFNSPIWSPQFIDKRETVLFNILNYFVKWITNKLLITLSYESSEKINDPSWSFGIHHSFFTRKPMISEKSAIKFLELYLKESKNWTFILC